ncbi:mycofactocin oligosaccharide methyltransferase MftM [Barrientosiimonas endolithica]|uniref:SAM-dependent methyltransferase n=1 Tax=Barrientosiimonas endolithica TaxID=1535208 RepID=A0ABN6YM14_9MICO|nr:mycofactocin oligosaccharide methyltransferase MftM [Barrientosiimonas endolithica]BDZ56468.1 SAM-dependent methyltransferase [Barrientosiimonas endolithica]
MTGLGDVDLDAFRPCPGGVYRSAGVVVRRRRPSAGRRLGMTRTPTFDVSRAGDALLVEHALTATDVSDDLAGLLTQELFDPGWVRGAELFEEIFTGVVLTCAGDPREAWIRFYRNTIRRLDDEIRTPTGRGSIAQFAPVHAHVTELVRGPSVLELGSCFGFQALRLAARGLDVTASDLAPGTVALLAEMSASLQVPVRTLVADASRVPLPDRCADTVLVVHLLEHVEPDVAVQVVREACRLARRRVVVAVPFDREPQEQFGHLRCLTLADVRAWGEQTDWAWTAYEHHGGWLVLDRPR